MMRHLLIIVSVLLLAACSSVPFQKTADVPLDAVDPRAAVERFRDVSPESFQLLNTIIFQYNWRQFSGIGYIDVHRGEQTFTVVCLNHMGIKLFEISGKGSETNAHFVMDEFNKMGNLAAAVGEDIRRIYFDLVPSREAAIEKRKYNIVFRQQSGPGVMEFVFAGTACALVEKTYYEDGSPAWRISYYEYRNDNGKLYPGGIILENFKYGYSLTARLKEIHA